MYEFIEIPVVLSGQGTEAPDKEVMAKIRKDSIAMYYPAYHWGTFIALVGGQSMLTTYTTQDIDIILLNHRQ